MPKVIMLARQKWEPAEKKRATDLSARLARSDAVPTREELAELLLPYVAVPVDRARARAALLEMAIDDVVQRLVDLSGRQMAASAEDVLKVMPAAVRDPNAPTRGDATPGENEIVVDLGSQQLKLNYNANGARKLKQLTARLTDSKTEPKVEELADIVAPFVTDPVEPKAAREMLLKMSTAQYISILQGLGARQAIAEVNGKA